MFFNVLEINGIKLQESVKDQLFKKFGSGTNINEIRQQDYHIRDNTNLINYKDAFSNVYVNMESANPLEE